MRKAIIFYALVSPRLAQRPGLRLRLVNAYFKGF
jgi:hypothetical protein